MVLTLTKFVLVLLLSSSGMGRKTARAIQLAKMANRMMISKVLHGEAQDMTTAHEKDWQNNTESLIAIHGENIWVTWPVRLCESALLTPISAPRLWNPRVRP